MSKKTAEVILASGNDFLIQVKGNAKKLHAWVQNQIENSPPSDQYLEEQTSRGRIEKRNYKVYHLNATDKLKGWECINQVIISKNSGVRTKFKKRKKEPYEKVHYYITSRKADQAKYIGARIKGHWGIENKCHWVKDAILYEDNSRVKGLSLSGNLSTFRLIVMNIYRMNNEKSIKKAIEKYCNRLAKCSSFIQ